MKQRILTVLALPLLSLAGLAGIAPNATLSITKTQGAQADTIEFRLTGSDPMSFQFFVVDDATGDFTFDFQGRSIELGVAPPFVPLPVGFTDLRGDLGFSVQIPTDISLGETFFVQAVGITPPIDTPFFSIPLEICASNVASFDV